MSSADLLTMYDSFLAASPNCCKRMRRLARLDGRAISAMIVAAEARTSPLSAIVLHHLHGAAARVRPEATGFAMRREHFMLEAIAAWHSSANDNGAGHRLWAQNLSDSTRPTASADDCGNQLWLDQRDKVAGAYADNSARLSRVKEIFDPEYALRAAPLPRSAGRLADRAAINGR